MSIGANPLLIFKQVLCAVAMLALSGCIILPSHTEEESVVAQGAGQYTGTKLIRSDFSNWKLYSSVSPEGPFADRIFRGTTYFISNQSGDRSEHTQLNRYLDGRHLYSLESQYGNVWLGITESDQDYDRGPHRINTRWELIQFDEEAIIQVIKFRLHSPPSASDPEAFHVFGYFPRIVIESQNQISLYDGLGENRKRIATYDAQFEVISFDPGLFDVADELILDASKQIKGLE